MDSLRAETRMSREIPPHLLRKHVEEVAAKERQLASLQVILRPRLAGTIFVVRHSVLSVATVLSCIIVEACTVLCSIEVLHHFHRDIWFSLKAYARINGIPLPRAWIT